MGSTPDCTKQNKDLVDLKTSYLKLSNYRCKRKEKKKWTELKGFMRHHWKKPIHEYGNLRIEERENEQKAFANNGAKLSKFESSQIQKAQKPPSRITHRSMLKNRVKVSKVTDKEFWNNKRKATHYIQSSSHKIISSFLSR